MLCSSYLLLAVVIGYNLDFVFYTTFILWVYYVLVMYNYSVYLKCILYLQKRVRMV